MSQSARVITVMRDGKWRTLRQIESAILAVFQTADTQTAISARLREGVRLAQAGWLKETRKEKINDKQVWYYRLRVKDENQLN